MSEKDPVRVASLLSPEVLNKYNTDGQDPLVRFAADFDITQGYDEPDRAYRARMVVGITQGSVRGTQDDIRAAVLQVMPVGVEFLCVVVGGAANRTWWARRAVGLALWLLERAGYRVIR